MDDLERDAVEQFRQIPNDRRLELRLSEKLIDASETAELDDGLQMELDHLVEIMSSEDAYEGLSSLGRRRPVFKGR